MGRKQVLLIVAVLAALFAWQAIGVAAGVGEIPRMTKEELKSLLGSPKVVVLDVRFEGGTAPTKIAGAIYESPERVADWSFKYPKENRIVLYCS
ncbi:MAG: hypothetical protein HKM86_10140 [Deltaproteobacteria bacterium]|nr:hypothetical protein [Deltaproteobacteria bacterium]